ncbi:MAG: porphobilinogen synthase [Candidatus Obscuribacterales bacterium]|nr:porphobilinogen synthase [Candidatus Obscuribacterales bacterium]
MSNMAITTKPAVSEATFPSVRMRRMRATSPLRGLVSETKLSVEKLIYPLFIVPGNSVKKPISSMPGIHQQSIDSMLKEVEEVQALGIKGVILFGIPENKDDRASQAFAKEGITQEAIRAIKNAFPEMIVIADTCLCEYMDHGHCGIATDNGIDNDESVKILVKAAISQAEAGADIIAPSDMMDGRIGAIRKGLDKNGFENIPIMAYSAKFASGFYGPFREAAESAPRFGDRTSYQMDPANGREAIREIELDIAEGADVVMVKPALAYLDVIARARMITNLPIAAYNVSGEYSMIKAAAANGWIDERRVVLETLTGIFRAGADIIITYHAKDVATWLS